MNNRQAGSQGEQEVIDLISCPNCGNKLVLLPTGFPMYDVQCSRCMFRAQIKTVNSRPRTSIFGAGYDIYEKVLKAGYLSPPLIINFRWESDDAFSREIRFYPFIAKGNILKYQLSPTARRANYKMFKYVKLDKIPYLVLHQLYDPLKKT